MFNSQKLSRAAKSVNRECGTKTTIGGGFCVKSASTFKHGQLIPPLMSSNSATRLTTA
jgi:hypothetical protein